MESNALASSVSVSGAPGQIRTADLLVRSQTLYPTELRARENYYSKPPCSHPCYGVQLDKRFKSCRPDRRASCKTLRCLAGGFWLENRADRKCLEKGATQVAKRWNCHGLARCGWPKQQLMAVRMISVSMIVSGRETISTPHLPGRSSPT
jgi:hypothetical protein